jgi:hypothetical protein
MNQKSATQNVRRALFSVPTVAAALPLMQGLRESGQDPDEYDWKIAELATSSDPLLFAPEVVQRAVARLASNELKRIFTALPA